MIARRDWEVYITGIGIPEKSFRLYTGIVRDDIRYHVFFHKVSYTSIWFYSPAANYDKILCVYFINAETRGWSGELKDLDFSEQNVRKLSDFLRPALLTGWLSVDYYLTGRYITSSVKEKEDGSGKTIQKISSYYNFWSYLMLPLCYFLDRLMQLEIIGSNDKVSVRPILKNASKKNNKMYALVYQSTVSDMFDDFQIKGLLEQARDFNRRNEVTGCLLYSNESFVQYIEGNQRVIIDLFDRIKNDIRHKDVLIISSGAIDQREFQSWDMAYEDFMGKNDHLQFLELLLNSFFEKPNKSIESGLTSVYFWRTARRILATRTVIK